VLYTHCCCKDQLCYGADLSQYEPSEGWSKIELQWLLEAYSKFPRKEEFFTAYFNKLAGNSSLKKQIEAGWNEEQIRLSWQKDLEGYLKKREGYMIYD